MARDEAPIISVQDALRLINELDTLEELRAVARAFKVDVPEGQAVTFYRSSLRLKLNQLDTEGKN